MREIKYRAWDENQKCFHYSDNLRCSVLEDGNYWFVGDWSEHPDYFLDGDTTSIPIEQYTGLKDINGKEIYEGDIMQSDTEIKMIVVAGHYQTFVDDWGVPHYSTGFALKFTDESGYSDFGSSLEIIGNIHDNPELLEKP